MTGNTAPSITELQQKAQEGDAQAQLDLAYRLSAENNENNHEFAFQWLSSAAELGNDEAQLVLGICCADIGCYFHDDSRIQEFIWKNEYRVNYSEENSEEIGWSWILKAANQNNGLAQYALYRHSFRGIKTLEKWELAFGWLKKAAENGCAKAQYRLARFYDSGIVHESGFVLEKNKDLAFKWFEKAALAGLAAAQYELACRYLNGDGVEQSYEKAYEWLIKLTGQEEGENYDNACMLLGDLCVEGKGIQQSDELAIAWYERYAQSIQDSLDNLYERERDEAGKLYRTEKYYNLMGPNESATVRRCYEILSQRIKDSTASPNEQKHWEAIQLILAEKNDCLKKQKEVKTRIGICCHQQATRSGLTSKQAYEWHKKAAEYGNAESQYWLSYHLLTGGIQDQEQTQEPMTHGDRYYEAINLAYDAAEGGCLEATAVLISTRNTRILPHDLHSQ